jgi:hypothetical protein
VKYDDWMRRSEGARLTVRSGPLKQIDEAFKRLEMMPNRGSAEGLITALQAWKRTKPRWTATILNKDGAVEDLTRWAELKVKVFGGGNVMAQAAAAASRLTAGQDEAYRRDPTAIKQWIAGDPQFGSQMFEWTVKLDLVQRGTVVEVFVRIKSPELSSDERSIWNSHIGSAWNIATVVTGSGVKKRHFDLRFNIEWVGASYGGPCYVVGAKRPPPNPAAKSLYVKGITDTHGDTAHVKQWANNQWAGGQAWGFRANMAEWAVTDRQAIIHEFGHVIGCPDEYLCTNHQGTGQTHSDAVHNQAPFSTNSIMNDTSQKGRIFDRHFAYVRETYRRWKPTATADIKIMNQVGMSKPQEEIQSLLHEGLARQRRRAGYSD